MHKKWIHQTSTSFLLVLFVFIHVVKTFHTHDYSDAYSIKAVSKNATVVKTGFACAICSFQIAKDSDAESSTLSISTPLHFITAYYSYTLLKLYKLSITTSARGPPANIF